VNALVSELFGLEDQVAVVTGASGVLGGEIARGLAAAGALSRTRAVPLPS
jgi:NAD(P)-dependent dehydrogenase (short-subunit alcohol dehydrogenase family)